jgi:hypothetical protein
LVIFILINYYQILSDLDFKKENDIDLDCLSMIKQNHVAIDLSLKMLKPGGIMLMKALKGYFEPNN